MTLIISGTTNHEAITIDILGFGMDGNGSCSI
jgi:hypothetical protein